MMILVTTASKVGSEASRLLGERGVPVRVLVRNGKKAAGLARAGAEVFEGDLEVPATINSAMKGVSSVMLVSPPVLRQELNVIASAVPRGRSARRKDYEQSHQDQWKALGLLVLKRPQIGRCRRALLPSRGLDQRSAAGAAHRGDVDN